MAMTSNVAGHKTLAVVLGATATGKTGVGIRLAQAFGSEIVSSDSRQIYREMSIGTAKPTAEELAAVPHHFIDTRSVSEDYSAGRYEEDALRLLGELFAKHDLLFLVGGSGLYIDAVCDGMDPLPAVDEGLRRRLTERFRGDGLAPLLVELEKYDPAYYRQVDRENPHRVIRALEVCLQTGRPYSSLRRGEGKQRPFDILKIGIRMPRETLYRRIDDRVDGMVAEGLEREARALYPLRDCNALQTVGYREFFEYFDGKITRDKAIELIKRNSRRYAKRQQTWFGRDDRIEWFVGGEGCAESIEKYLRKFV